MVNTGLLAQEHDIVVQQGATFKKTLAVKDTGDQPIDLTGYTARMQVRTDFEATQPALDLTTENSGIAINGPAGEIILTAADTATSTLSITNGFYDLELIKPSGDVVRLLQGKVTVSREITR